MTNKTPADLQEMPEPPFSTFKKITCLGTQSWQLGPKYLCMKPGCELCDWYKNLSPETALQAAAPAGECEHDWEYLASQFGTTRTCEKCYLYENVTPAPAETTKEQPQNNYNLSCPAESELREFDVRAEFERILYSAQHYGQCTFLPEAVDAIRSHLERQAAGEAKESTVSPVAASLSQESDNAEIINTASGGAVDPLMETSYFELCNGYPHNNQIRMAYRRMLSVIKLAREYGQAEIKKEIDPHLTEWTRLETFLDDMCKESRTQGAAVDVESLKREERLDYGYDDYSHGYDTGWNQCVDKLHEQGHLPAPSSEKGEA